MSRFVEDLREDKVKERVKLADNRDRFTKVGFDLFRENDTDFVWKTQEVDNEVWLVRNEEEPEVQTKESNWTSVVHRNGQNVTLAYKNRPLYCFAGKDFGFDKDDAPNFSNYIVNKATDSKEFIKRMFSLFPQAKKAELLKQFPELETITS